MRSLCLALLLLPASVREFPGAREENIHGAVLTKGNHPALITWGDRLIAGPSPTAKKVLATPATPFRKAAARPKTRPVSFSRNENRPANWCFAKHLIGKRAHH